VRAVKIAVSHYTPGRWESRENMGPTCAYSSIDFCVCRL